MGGGSFAMRKIVGINEIEQGRRQEKRRGREEGAWGKLLGIGGVEDDITPTFNIKVQ